MTQAWHEFWLAWQFLTRLPAPITPAYSEHALNRSSRYFPWVGLVVGALLALVFLLAQALFGQLMVSLVLVTIAGLVVTGAFHEDGFADYCDSFGGHDVRSRLAIMQDSRLGTFGVAGLVSVLALRIAFLAALPPTLIPAALIAGHGLSRWLAISLIVDNDYVKPEGKSKPLAASLDKAGLLFGGVPLLLLFALLSPIVLLVTALVLLLFRQGFAWQLRKRLGGYTGDCLGAAQQSSEVLVYAALALCL